MREKTKKALSGVGILVCIAAYITGMTGYGRVSDILLMITLALVILGDIFFWVSSSENDDLKKKKQLIILQLLFLLLGLSLLVYRRKTILENPVSVVVAVLAMVWFVCGILGLRKSWKHFGSCTKRIIRENRDGFLICGIFLLFSWSEIISISQWDGTFYINSLNRFVAEYDLTFKTLLNANMGGHLSTGYSLIAGIFHMFFNWGNIGVKICNILLGWGGILGFYKILEKMEMKRFFCFAGTLMFAVSPMFLGTIGFISVDYAMMVYFIFFLYSWLYEKDIFMVLTGFLFLFTKETAIVIYFFFWFGIFLYRTFSMEAPSKIRWKKLLGVISKAEWKAIIIPVGLFLLTFGVYAYEKLGWPGLMAGNLKISPKLAVAGILLVALLLAMIEIWLILWHFVRKRELRKSRKHLCETGVLCLPVFIGIVGVLLIWTVKPEIIRSLVVHSSKDINRIGLGKAHIAAILKQAYVLNFSWILLIIVGIGLFCFLKEWNKRTAEKRELVIAMLLADIGLVFFTMIYVTYQNPRYLQLHYALFMLLAAILWGDIWRNRKQKQIQFGNAAFGIVIVLLFCETFVYIDPLTRMAFYNRDIGNGVLCAGSTKEVSGVDSSYSDRAVNNRVYSYYLKNIEKFLKDIKYDGSQTIIFSKKKNWVVLGRKDLSTMDTELKCIVSYEGSIADSVVHAGSIEELETYMTGTSDVYYVDTGAIHAKMDQIVEETYPEQVYKTFTTGSWRTTVYKLENK